MSQFRLLWALLVALLLLPGAAAEAQSVGEVFKRVNPSAVTIRARWTEAAAEGQLGRVSEVGSGVLISTDGQVITAAHVVQTAGEITAEFLDGEQVGATVIASEPEADVSLLRLARSPSRPVVARLGHSDRVQVGDQIFVIGAPYSIGHTLSV